MVTITKDNKLQEIESIRQYFVNQYGVVPGFRASKDLIDSVQAKQEVEAVKAQRIASMSLELLQSLKDAHRELSGFRYNRTDYWNAQLEKISETIRKADAALA